jgi:surface protein
MEYMFYNCYNLKKIYFYTFDTKNVENMSCMFMECIKLVSLNISSFDLKKVNNMEFMFKDCRGLEEIYVDKNKNKNLIQSQIGKDNINPYLKSD